MSSLTAGVVAVVTCLNVLACAWLIWWTARERPDEAPPGEVTEHVWDGDLRERNNPMPRWWLVLFFMTIVFCLIYFLLYPALGRFGGVLHWSAAGRYQKEMAQAQQQYGPVYAAFAGRPLTELARDPKALALGRSLFINTCAQCHGSDARGAAGFPNLTDQDWIYGGDPETIVQTITRGREGIMPALGPALGPQGVDEVVAYVESLSGRKVATQLAAAGKTRFALCAGCHGADGAGNQQIGAPNLTYDIWLYGGSDVALHKTVTEGRHGTMPSHRWLGDDRIRVLAAYVYSLSHPQ